MTDTLMPFLEKLQSLRGWAERWAACDEPHGGPHTTLVQIIDAIEGQKEMNVNGKDEKPINRRSDDIRSMKAEKDFPRNTLEGNGRDGWTPGSQSRDDPRAKKRTK